MTESLNKWTEKYDVSDKDTCHSERNINVKKIDGEIIIESIDIVNSNQGCQGHPKTMRPWFRISQLKF